MHLHSRAARTHIAPAVIIPYTDIDGDLVKITDSSNTLTLANLTLSGGTAGQLQTLDLTDPGFADAIITFSVVKKPGGDGAAHLGFIDAAGVDLGSVTVKGDLGRIVVGDATTTTPGLDVLNALSIGARGLTTQGLGGTLTSVVTGALGKLTVKGSLVEASLSVVNGTLGSVAIGKNLQGGSADGSGLIFSQGAMGNVTIGGSILGAGGDNSGRLTSAASIGNVTIARNLQGSSGDESGTIEAPALGKLRVGVNIVGGGGAAAGSIQATGAVADILVGGSVIGGTATDTGSIKAGTLGPVKIGGDLLGRTGAGSGSISSTTGGIGTLAIGHSVEGAGGPDSGSIVSATTIGNITIGRGLTGNSGSRSGRIESAGDLGSVTIGGDVRGGSADGAGQILSAAGDIGRVSIGGWLVGGSIDGALDLADTGSIRADGSIASVSVGGSIFAGVATNGGRLFRSGAVIAGADLGPVSVGGSLLGNSSNTVKIIASGQSQLVPTLEDRAIASVTVKGDANYAEILAGFTVNFFGNNADASIGIVRVGGDWIAGSIVAGAEDLPTVNGYGTGDRLQTAFDDVAQVARIAEITIGGNVGGTAGITNDHFGFVAQRIDKVRIAGGAVTLTAGPNNDDRLIAGTNDFRVLEVPVVI